MNQTALRSLWAMLCLLLGVLGACTSEEAAMTIKALRPGDLDYPKLNAAPKQIVEVTAIIPDGWPADFHLLYLVPAEQVGKSSKFVAPAGCAWKQSAQFKVDQLLPLERKGDEYRGKFSIDQFEPSLCRWELAFINSPVVRGRVSTRVQSATQTTYPIPGLDLENVSINIWCTKHGKRTRPSNALPDNLENRYDCTTYGLIENFTDLPIGFKQSIPQAQEEWRNTFSQRVRTMKIEIHDLDRMIPEYLNRNLKK